MSEADTVEKAEAERKRAPAANFLPIVRGRLPLIFVHAIRFDPVVNAMGNKDLATKFGTTVGKVFDIKKGRNFAYVTEGFKPTQDDLAAAETWISQIGNENAKGLTAAGDKMLMEQMVAQYRERGLATAEDAAQFAAARTAARTKTEKAPKGEKSAAGGEAATAVASSDSADDLLS